MMNKNCNASAGAFYGLGLIGVLVYYLQQVSTAGEVLAAIGKAIVWPAILAYNLFGFLQIA